jgi:hypothetical protein
VTRDKEIVPHQVRGTSLIRSNAAGVSRRDKHVIRFCPRKIVVNGLCVSEVNLFREKIAIAFMFQLSNDSGADESFCASYKNR